MIPIGSAGTAIAVFDTKPYDQRFLDKANAGFEHHLTFYEARLDQSTVQLAAGFPAICAFVNDRLDEAVLTQLAAQGTRIVALRCAGYNIVDDDVFQRLLTFPNVLVTGHQAFLTEEALTAIAETTLQSIADAVAGRPLIFQIADGIALQSRANRHD